MRPQPHATLFPWTQRVQEWAMAEIVDGPYDPARHEEPLCGRVLRTSKFAGLSLVDGVYFARSMVPRHAHENAGFCVALTGICNETFAGKQRQYEVSTVEFLPANQCHSLDFPHADTRAFSIDIGDYWIERAREFSLRLEGSVHVQGGPLSGLIMSVYAEFSHLDSASAVSIQGLVLEMLAAVSRSNSNPSRRRPHRWLARVEELLRAHFTARLTLTQIAAAAGVHPVYLAREFRRFHGCTIGEYVRRLRIERACHRLGASDESLAAIAAGSGFSDQSHLTRTFRRLVGTTPARYRANFNRR